MTQWGGLTCDELRGLRRGFPSTWVREATRLDHQRAEMFKTFLMSRSARASGDPADRFMTPAETAALRAKVVN